MTWASRSGSVSVRITVMAPPDREGHDHDRPAAHRDEDARGTVDERRMSQRVRARTHHRPGRDLARAAHDEGPLGASHPKLRPQGEHGEQPREVAPADRCVERGSSDST
jgi:hypothetical protein